MLDSFWNLAVDDEERRISAAKVLLDELIAGQREHEESRRSKDGSINNLPPDVDKLPKPKRQELALRRCSPLMIYALRRLVRGLGSGREGARQGFATALTLLLSKEGQPAASSTFMDAEDVMILIETCLEVSSTVKAGVSNSTCLPYPHPHHLKHRGSFCSSLMLNITNRRLVTSW